jgi:flagellar hook-associated protein 2
VGGTNPAGAGLSAGVGGAYRRQLRRRRHPHRRQHRHRQQQQHPAGIVAAINKGGFGVTASIVSDGSTGTNATPNHLILTSTATGATRP